MPTTEVTINNKPLSTMGVAMLSGAYAALLTPPSLKEFVENDDPTQNGIDIIVPDSLFEVTDYMGLIINEK